MAEDPRQIALEELRQHQEKTGMTFENPDAPAEFADDDGRVPGWMTRDEEFR
jgi:hypothetical protein